MPRICQLPLHEVQKIAAGEVVERPANVVKELIENALDAGATQITLYIDDAGKQLIRIVDNGCGMDTEDAYLCFKQHATSKITCVEDLHSVATFGFRGEALSSIAAVSNITLITKTEEALFGTQLELAQGQVTEEKEVSHTTGTDIQIRDLFFNVPARKKFLKTNETELRQITNLFFACALDYRNVHFKLIVDGRVTHNCPAAETLSARLAQLWDRALTSNTLEISATSADGNISIYGAITNHQYFRFNRNEMIFFVNSRWVKNHTLASALMKGYLNVLPAGRYPAVCLFITVNKQHVDINIHPRKEEVQFLHPRMVEQLIQSTVKKALEEHLSAHIKKPVTLKSEPTPQQRMPFPDYPFGIERSAPRVSPFAQETTASYAAAYSAEPFADEEIQESTELPTSATTQVASAVYTYKTPPTQSNEYGHDTTSQPKSTLAPIADANSYEAADQQQPLLLEEQMPVIAAEEHDYTIIGQLHKTYILLETPAGLFVIDQHAAHERIMYELFSTRFHEVATIRLLFPQIITLSRADVKLLSSYTQLFCTNGIELDILSETQITIHAAPVNLKDISLTDLVHQVIAWIEELGAAPHQELFKEVTNKLHAQMACKAAIKAGDVLSTKQMEQVIADLYKTNNRFICAHGRPTGWLLDQYEIEKKFKRKL